LACAAAKRALRADPATQRLNVWKETELSFDSWPID
jgi:hypothetical protein